MDAVRRDAQLDRLMSELAWLRRLASALTRNGPEADDLVQDTWLVAREHAPTDDRPLKPWLTRVALNLVRMRSRGTKRRIARDVAAIPVATTVPSPDELVSRVEAQKIVVDQVLLLAEPYRSTVLLHYVEDLSCAEIARRLDIPDGTVRRRLKVALDELRGRLREHEQTTGRAVLASLAPLAVPVASGASVGTTALGALVMKKIVASVVLIIAAVLAVAWLRHPAPEPSTTLAKPSGSDTPIVIAPGHAASTSRLAVEVRDARGPIADATVRLVRSDGEVTIARSSRDGLAATPAEPGRWSVSASAEGHEPRAEVVDVVASRDAHVSLVLTAGGVSLSGTIVDASGGPVAGARVDAARHDGTRPSRAVSVAISDTAGHYELTVQGGPLVVAASSPDYAPQTRHVDVGPSGATLDFTLVPGGVVEGIVRDDRTKEPVANAIVRARHDAAALDLAEAMQRVVMTDAKGAFRLAGLRPGAYELSARDGTRSSRAPVRLGLGVAEQQAEIEILVGATATIRGTVVDESGAAAADVVVRVLDVNTAESAQATSDASGRFVVAGLVPNRWTLRGASDRYLSDNHTIVELKASDVDGIVVHVRKGLALAGHVEPRQNCEVALALTETGDQFESHTEPTVTTSEDGAFQFAPVASGPTTLTARCPAGDRGTSTVTVASDTRDHVVHVEAGTSIAGLVVDTAGKPIGGVTVAAELGDAGTATMIMNGAVTSGARAITTSDGAFEIRGLTAARYRLSAIDRGRPMKTTAGTSLSLATGQHATGTRLVVDKPSGTIRGTVTGPDGAPLADAWVSLHQSADDLIASLPVNDDGSRKFMVQSDGNGGDELPPALTDARGHFELTNVPHGRYEVIGEAHAGAMRGSQLAVTPDATVNLQLSSLSSIRGTVHGARGPSELFSVELVGPSRDPSVAEMPHGFGAPPSETRSFTDGTFVFRRVDPGTYALEVTSSDGTGKTTTRVTAGDGASVDIALVANAVITGRLVDPSGKPIASRSVAMIPDQAPGQLQIMLNGPVPSSGPDGRFRVEADPARRTLVVLGAPPTLKPSLAVAAGKTLDVGDVIVGAAGSPAPSP